MFVAKESQLLKKERKGKGKRKGERGNIPVPIEQCRRNKLQLLFEVMMPWYSIYALFCFVVWGLVRCVSGALRVTRESDYIEGNGCAYKEGKVVRGVSIGSYLIYITLDVG